MVGVLVMLVLGAVVKAHENHSAETRNVHSTKLSDDATGTAYNLAASELLLIQSVLSQLKDNTLTKDNTDKKDVPNASDEETTAGTVTDSLQTSDNKDRSDSQNNDTKRKNVLEYLSKMLIGDPSYEASNTNRRLDFEDNGDILSDLVDIDDPRLNDYNQDEVVDFRNNRRFSGYGAMLDMKGRSGYDGLLSRMNIKTDQAIYHPPLSRHGLFINPGFYQSLKPQPIPFTKMDDQDLKHPINILKNFPFRRLEVDAGEGIARTDDSLKSQDMDMGGNAYRYEPEELVKPPWAYRR